MRLIAFLLFALTATVVASNINVRAPLFESGKFYHFRYDSQIASDISSIDSLADEQKLFHRLSALVKVNFETDRSATLRLEDIHIASLNGELPEMRQVQPFRLFDEEAIESQKLKELEMPCSFLYNEGIIEEIYFKETDPTWSKNVKKNVLNFVQIKLEKSLNFEPTNLPKTYTVNETIIEGICEVNYSITKAASADYREVFNVTKIINLKKCFIPRMHMESDTEVSSINTKPGDQLEAHQHNNEINIGSSTVFQYQIVGKRGSFRIENVMLLSDYVIHGEKISVVLNIYASELKIERVGQIVEPNANYKNSTKQETLFYSFNWDFFDKIINGHADGNMLDHIHFEMLRRNFLFQIDIWNGENVISGFRFMAQLRSPDGNRCSAVVIRLGEKPVLLCAKHCVLSDDYVGYDITLGSYIWNEGLMGEVQKIYRMDGSGFDNDLAIIFLYEIKDFYHFEVEAIKVAPSAPKMDELCTISGYGRKKIDERNIRLLKGQARVKERKDNHFKLFGRQGAARGDSGGAALTNGLLTGILVQGQREFEEEGYTFAVNLNSPKVAKFLKKYVN